MKKAAPAVRWGQRRGRNEAVGTSGGRSGFGAGVGIVTSRAAGPGELEAFRAEVFVADRRGTFRTTAGAVLGLCHGRGCGSVRSVHGSGVETDAAGDFTDLERAAANHEQLVEPTAWVDPEEVFGELELPLEDLAAGELEFDLASDGQSEIAGQLAAIRLASVVPGLESVGAGRAEFQFVLFHGRGREFEVRIFKSQAVFEGRVTSPGGMEDPPLQGGLPVPSLIPVQLPPDVDSYGSGRRCPHRHWEWLWNGDEDVATPFPFSNGGSVKMRPVPCAVRDSR